MQIAISSRESWADRQKELVQISVTYNQAIMDPVSGFVLKLFGSTVLLDPMIIVSSATRETFKTGIEESEKLFPDAKK